MPSFFMRKEKRVSTIHDTTDPEQDLYYINSIAEHNPQLQMVVIELQVSAPKSEKEV